MEYHNSYHLHLKIMTFWNQLGISPLHVLGVTRSKHETLSSVGGKLLQLSSNKKSKICAEEQSYPPNLDFDTSPVKEVHDFCKFPVFLIGSYRHSTRPILWIMVCFFYGTVFYAVTKLVLFLKSEKDEGIHAIVEGRDTVNQTVFIVGSIVWSLYCATGCAGYFIHFMKPDKLCALIANWQIVEGELISESNAMKASGESVESYLKRQRKGMLTFLLLMPISFVCLGVGTTYFDRFPMNMYSSVPREWVFERPWIKLLCHAFSWMQVGIFLVCESQMELFTLAFTQSLLKCLKVLSNPAADFYAQHRKRQQLPTCREAENLEKAEKLEMLEIFKDSVERFEKLKNLLDAFNEIFRWGLFMRKAFTMLKVCCYVYLLLRHPGDTGFPGAATFLYAAIAIFVKFGVILSTMGAVRVESENFLRSWEKVLLVIFPDSTAEEERRLKRAEPFGFRIGSFYIVNSSTILTFCSVISTYLIILLQLQ